MDATGGGTGNGTPIIQWTYHGAANQQWKLVANSDGTWKIQGVQSGKYLEIKTNTNANEVIIVLTDGTSPTTTAATQENFRLTLNAAGSYTGSFRMLTPVSSYTKGVVVQDASRNDGAALFQYTYFGGNDDWYLEPVPGLAKGASGLATTKAADFYGETYYIRNKSSGLYLDARNGATTNNTYFLRRVWVEVVPPLDFCVTHAFLLVASDVHFCPPGGNRKSLPYLHPSGRPLHFLTGTFLHFIPGADTRRERRICHYVKTQAIREPRSAAGQTTNLFNNHD